MGIAYDPRFIKAEDLDKDLIPIAVPQDRNVYEFLHSMPAYTPVIYAGLAATGYLTNKMDVQTTLDVTNFRTQSDTLPHRSNCINCGAPLKTTSCDYCETRCQ